MEASKVSVSPEHLRFTKMPRKRRVELRQRNIEELIRSKPAGTPITLEEFRQVTAYGSTAAAWGIVKTMLNRRMIARTQEGLSRYSYTVVADAPSTPAPKAETVKEPETPIHRVEPKRRTLSQYAREFAWEEDSDSLRGFVKWMDGKELDLRRLIDGGGVLVNG